MSTTYGMFAFVFPYPTGGFTIFFADGKLARMDIVWAMLSAACAYFMASVAFASLALRAISSMVLLSSSYIGFYLLCVVAEFGRLVNVSDEYSMLCGRWSGRSDLNRRPPVSKTGALPG